MTQSQIKVLAVTGLSYSFEADPDQFHVLLTLDRFYFNKSYRSSDECFNELYEHLSEQVTKAIRTAQDRLTVNQELVIEPIVPESQALEELLIFVVDEVKVQLNLTVV